MALLVALPFRVAGQFEVSGSTGAGWSAVNHARVAVTLLAVGESDTGPVVFDVVRLGPNESKTLGWGGSVRSGGICAWAVASPLVRINDASGCRSLALNVDSVREAEAQVAASGVSQSGAAQSAVRARRNAGDLEAENWLAWRMHEIRDPYREKAIELYKETDPVRAQTMLAENQATEQHAPGLAATMAAWEEMSERQSHWKTEASLLKPIAERLRDLKTILRGEIKDALRFEKAGRAFGKTAVTAMREAEHYAGSQAVAGVSRPCSGKAAVQDMIAVQPAPGSKAVGPLVGEVAFNDGTNSSFVAYPTKPDEARWLATVFWPVGARSGNVMVYPGGGRIGTSVGSISAGREDLKTALDKVESAESLARKKLKEADWKARGGTAAASGVAIQ